MNHIQELLFARQDLGYRDFHSKLIPNIDKERVVGVRTPVLRKLARELAGTEEAAAFLTELPHFYYEENNLHGLLIGASAKTPEAALDAIDRFLPYVDNWATCDMLPPKVLGKDKDLLRRRVVPWLDAAQTGPQTAACQAQPNTYRIRFAIVAMLSFLLDEGFEESDLDRLAAVKSDEYYVNMAIAWYYSFALIKQYEKTIGLIESRTLDKWVQNKSIQKAVESYRVPEERKSYLRTLRIK